MPKPVRTRRVNIKVTDETADAVDTIVKALSTEKVKWNPTDVYEAGVAALLLTKPVKEALKKAASAREKEGEG